MLVLGCGTERVNSVMPCRFHLVGENRAAGCRVGGRRENLKVKWLILFAVSVITYRAMLCKVIA